MNSPQGPTPDYNPGDPASFSLVVGGPLYQLYLRTGLAKAPLHLYARRILVITLIAWLPLLLLAVFNGVAVGGVKVPFVFDVDAHARFLLSLALLVAAEPFVHERMRLIVPQFLTRDLVAPEDRRRFERILASALRLRSLVIVELLLLVFVFTGGHWVWREYTALHVPTWYATPLSSGAALTPAGYWYAFASLPIFQFILIRWYFRLFIWYRFLWQVSRLRLRLNALHPDRTGGLGFLAGGALAFGLVLLAHTVLLAGRIGNRIWHEGATLPQFKIEISGMIIFLMLLVLVPLDFFLVALARTRRVGLAEYGVLASRYVNDFRGKWIRAGSGEGEGLLGTSDIQSLADLSNSFGVAREMRVLPIDRGTVVQLALLTALPLFPLALTMVPIEQMIDRAIKVIL